MRGSIELGECLVQLFHRGEVQMIKIEFSFTPPDTDAWEIDFPCPICKLETPITLGQVRREEYFICRGCHSTVKAIDHMGNIQNLRTQMQNLFR